MHEHDDHHPLWAWSCNILSAHTCLPQVLANTGITDDIVRAIAHNNNIAESGKIDSSAAQKKHVANAAKRMEGLLDRDKVQLRDEPLTSCFSLPHPFPISYSLTRRFSLSLTAFPSPLPPARPAQAQPCAREPTVIHSKANPSSQQSFTVPTLRQI